jgi:hypothetical protein
VNGLRFNLPSIVVPDAAQHALFARSALLIRDPNEALTQVAAT